MTSIRTKEYTTPNPTPMLVATLILVIVARVAVKIALNQVAITNGPMLFFNSVGWLICIPLLWWADRDQRDDWIVWLIAVMAIIVVVLSTLLFNPVTFDAAWRGGLLIFVRVFIFTIGPVIILRFAPPKEALVWIAAYLCLAQFGVDAINFTQFGQGAVTILGFFCAIVAIVLAFYITTQLPHMEPIRIRALLPLSQTALWTLILLIPIWFAQVMYGDLMQILFMTRVPNLSFGLISIPLELAMPIVGVIGTVVGLLLLRTIAPAVLMMTGSILAVLATWFVHRDAAQAIEQSFLLITLFLTITSAPFYLWVRLYLNASLATAFAVSSVIGQIISSLLISFLSPMGGSAPFTSMLTISPSVNLFGTIVCVILVVGVRMWMPPHLLVYSTADADDLEVVNLKSPADNMLSD